MKGGEDDVYTDTMALLDYGFDNFQLYNFSSSETSTTNAFPALFEDEDAMLTEVQSPLSVSNTAIVLPLEASFGDITKEVTMLSSETLTEGYNVIGDVSYYYADNYVGSAEIMYYSDKDVSFLPPVTEAPVSTETSVVSPAGSASPETREENDLRPLIIGIVVCGITLFGGFYLIFIELPYRRKKRNYRRRNRDY